VLFEHVYEEYATTTPAAPPSPVKLKQSDSFLASLVARDLDSDIEDAPEPAGKKSEFERYCLGEGGSGDAYKPLAWWKVVLTIFFFFNF
jgi:hypothetical protein